MNNCKFKKPIGKKSIFEFSPHSLSDHYETQENEYIKKFLVHIHLFFSVYKSVPSIEYLSFTMDITIDDIKKVIGYLCHHEWFSIVIARGHYSYSITDKFQKAFYHHLLK